MGKKRDESVHPKSESAMIKSNGGLSLSTKRKKNNARIILVDDPMARRCIEQVQELETPERGSQVLLSPHPIPFSTPFLVINFSVAIEVLIAVASKKLRRASSNAILVRPGERIMVPTACGFTNSQVWVIIGNTDSVVRMSSSSVVDVAQWQGAATASLLVRTMARGVARKHSQKSGTRMKPTDAIVPCLRIDFADGKTLWLDSNLAAAPQAAAIENQSERAPQP